MDNGLKEKIERLKAKSELFFSNKTKVFIVDTESNYYFCELILLEENYINFKCFTGKREGESFKKLWLDILDIDEYKEEEGK